MYHSKSKFAVYVATCALLMGCAPNNNVHMNQSESEAAKAIREYVSEHKHWSTDTYRIERQPDFQNYHVYDVINVEDEKRHYEHGVEVFESGAGKSFAVYYDPVKKQIVREMHFQ